MKRIYIILSIQLMITFLFVSCTSISNSIFDGSKNKHNYQRENDFQINELFYDTKKKNINDMDNQKLLVAVKQSEYETVENILKETKVFGGFKYSPNIYDNIGQTALMWACWNNDERMVKTLFEYQASLKKNYKVKIDVNSKSKHKYSAIFCAAYNGNDNLMNYLVEKGARITPNDIDECNENVLHKMAKSNKAGNIERFINTHRKYEWEKMLKAEDITGYTPFHYAIAKNNFEMVKYLYSLEKDHTKVSVLNIPAKFGEKEIYPLYTAFEVGNIQIFQFLLEQKELDLENITLPKDGEAGTENEKINRYSFDQKSSPSLLKVLPDYNPFADALNMRYDQWEEVSEAERPDTIIIKNEIIKSRC